MEVDDTDVMEFRRSIDERIEQDGRGRRGTVEVDLIPGGDRIDGLLGADSSHEVILTSRLRPRSAACVTAWNARRQLWGVTQDRRVAM